MRSTQKALVLHTKVYGCLKEMRLFELCTELITFFIKKKKKNFYLKEWLADKLRLFRPGYLGNIFLNVNEISLLLQN